MGDEKRLVELHARVVLIGRYSLLSSTVNEGQAILDCLDRLTTWTTERRLMGSMV